MSAFFHIRNASYRLSTIEACKVEDNILLIYCSGGKTPYQYTFPTEEEAVAYLDSLRTQLDSPE